MSLKQKVPASVRRELAPRVDAVLNVAFRRRRARLFQDEFAGASRTGPVKITIGSGLKPVDGWINTDVVWRGGGYLDATRPWPIPAGSVDFIYADNVIEHLTLAQGRLAFKHAFEALKPGGVIRLATPDVGAVASQYLENGELAEEGMARNRELGHSDFYHSVQLLQQVFVGHKHYLGFCYDYESISSEMAKVGFDVHRAASGQSDYPELKNLEARQHPAEQATCLIVEGIRPTA